MLKKSLYSLVAVAALSSPAMAQNLSVDGNLNGDVQVTSVSGNSSIEGLSYSSVESQIGGGYAVAGNLQMTGVDANSVAWSSNNDVGGSMSADGYNLNVSGVVSGGNALGNAEGLSGFDAEMSYDGFAAALDVELDVEIGAGP